MKLRISKFQMGFAAIIAVGMAQGAFAAVNDYTCGPLANGFGPFDYRKDKANLPVVEFHHFTPRVYNLVEGESGTIAGDIDYTLRAFPNHPRALMAMIRYGEMTHRERPIGAKYSVECYLYRAWKWQPDDPTVRVIYASWLAGHHRLKEALNHLRDAEQMGEDSPNFEYNLGLIYFEVKDYDKALSYAHKAYAKGYTLPGLRNLLIKAGHWKEQKNGPAPAVQPVISDNSAK